VRDNLDHVAKKTRHKTLEKKEEAAGEKIGRKRRNQARGKNDPPSLSQRKLRNTKRIPTPRCWHIVRAKIVKQKRMTGNNTGKKNLAIRAHAQRGVKTANKRKCFPKPERRQSVKRRNTK